MVLSRVRESSCSTVVSGLNRSLPRKRTEEDELPAPQQARNNDATDVYTSRSHHSMPQPWKALARSAKMSGAVQEVANAVRPQLRHKAHTSRLPGHKTTIVGTLIFPTGPCPRSNMDKQSRGKTLSPEGNHQLLREAANKESFRSTVKVQTNLALLLAAAGHNLWQT
ncbi:hypothetical protein NDU88_011081 [Pleurodeles waltl]|uniref:Uncharacterized protein n=1 Tax=Pleurodeles waltl TaxID=8319 RepID=A0AAV7PXM9_PLEWA|nr:hypothetical protein NDU88_011081 [Pleurodeles waltl]